VSFELPQENIAKAATIINKYFIIFQLS